MRRKNAIVQQVWKKNERFRTVLNQPSEAVQELPYFSMLPKDEVGLLKWRIYVRERALHDLKFRAQIWQMCKEDVLFFASTFMYIFEPRGEATMMPLMLWTDQCDVLAVWSKYFGHRDLIVPKSRGIGISWMLVVLFLHRWLFFSNIDLALVSKDNDSLDIVNRPATLMGKLDVAFAALPEWAKNDKHGKSILKRTGTQHRFENRLNGAAIVGYASTDEKLRGGRFTAVGFDEVAFYEADVQRMLISAQYVSHCRMFISTYNGTNMFFRLVQEPRTALVVETYWTANPVRWGGAYKFVNGQIQFLDPGYKYPEGYEFIDDGLLRSVWFDQELNRTGSTRAAALEELNGIAAQNSRRMMTKRQEDAAIASGRPAPYYGTIEDGVWIDDADGNYAFWIPPQSKTNIVYIGADPAVGVADAAEAAMTAIDGVTGQVIMSAAFRDCQPIDFARKVVAAAKFLGGTVVINWETTGIGITFTNELKRLNYGLLYQQEDGKLGWHNMDRGEAILFESMRAIADGEVFLSDEKIREQLTQFEYDRENNLLFMGQDSHGDRAMSFAIAWNAAKNRRKAALLSKRRTQDTIQRSGVEYEPEYRAEQENRWMNRFNRGAR